MTKLDLIVILGATATGKTSLATTLALEIDAEIISADSRQVYRGMDIGTGKDISEFVKDGKTIPYHLIDIVDAGEDYNVFRYQEDFLKAYEGLKERKKYGILCGGTGMYIESIIKGYRFLPTSENVSLRKKLEVKTNKELEEVLKSYKKVHNTTDLKDKNRLIRAIEIADHKKNNGTIVTDFPKINSVIFGIHMERDELKKRITERLKRRLKQGMVEEVEGLIANGVSTEKLKFYGLEYKFIAQFLDGEISKKLMLDRLEIAIHQFSKRQTTWFRKMERNGININWLDGKLPLEEQLKFLLDHLKG